MMEYIFIEKGLPPALFVLQDFDASALDRKSLERLAEIVEADNFDELESCTINPLI